MNHNTALTCWIIAGPNGAGKTTFALNYLPALAGCRQFINADLIAAGLSPLAPEQQLVSASRLFLAQIEQCITAQTDFAFETTLAGKSYLKLIKRLQTEGWRVELIYLALPSAEMSQMRVAERVLHGGHNIPIADVIRRFPRSLYNLLYLFAPLVDQTKCYMNNGDQPALVFQQSGSEQSILNPDLFHHLKAQAKS